MRVMTARWQGRSDGKFRHLQASARTEGVSSLAARADAALSALDIKFRLIQRPKWKRTFVFEAHPSDWDRVHLSSKNPNIDNSWISFSLALRSRSFENANDLTKIFLCARSPEAKDDYGWTPMFWASLEGRLNILESFQLDTWPRWESNERVIPKHRAREKEKSLKNLWSIACAQTKNVFLVKINDSWKTERVIIKISSRT